MKVDGKTMVQMAREFINMKMDLNIRESGAMEKKKDMGDIFLPMVMCMKAISVAA